MYSDVFGFASGNHRTFADELQKTLGDSYVVLLPDFYRVGGNPANLPAWLPEFAGLLLMFPTMCYRIKYTYPEEVIIDRDCKGAVVPYIKENFGIDNLSCVGFCFGGWCVAKSLALPKKGGGGSIFKCGVGIHVSGGEGSPVAQEHRSSS